LSFQGMSDEAGERHDDDRLLAVTMWTVGAPSPRLTGECCGPRIDPLDAIYLQFSKGLVSLSIESGFDRAARFDGRGPPLSYLCGLPAAVLLSAQAHVLRLVARGTPEAFPLPIPLAFGHRKSRPWGRPRGR